MQGDCLSAILFILYLAYALGHKSNIENEHRYSLPVEEDPTPQTPKSLILDHTYAKPITISPPSEVITIQPKYADDITFPPRQQ